MRFPILNSQIRSHKPVADLRWNHFPVHSSLMLTACDQAAANHFAHRPELHIRHTSKNIQWRNAQHDCFPKQQDFARAGKMTRTSKSNTFKIQIHSILLVWKKTQLKSHKIRIVAAKSRYCVMAVTPAEAYASFMPDGQKVEDLESKT